MLRGQVLQDGGVIGHGLRTVRQRLRQFRPGPVEHRHEIVTDDGDADFGQIAQGEEIVFDVAVPRRQAQLDILMDIDAFDCFQPQAGGFDFRFQGQEFIHRPDFADRHVEQSADDSLDARDLPDVLQRERFILLPVPAKGHFHTIRPPRR